MMLTSHLNEPVSIRLHLSLCPVKSHKVTQKYHDHLISAIDWPRFCKGQNRVELDSIIDLIKLNYIKIKFNLI